MKHFYCILALLTLDALTASADTYDIVVYGGTSGGVVAATQAARDGRSVVLISPTAHLGGLTSSGLGWTDLGNSSILGGLSRDFYHRVYLHYQNNAAWNWQTSASYGNTGQGGPAFNDTTQIASVFEPKVAKQVFNQWITEEGVPVITGRLDLQNGVQMAGQRITGLRLEDGRVFQGSMFIDASYEGDLLPGAGVSFTTVREANATYGETVNGIQVAKSTKNQLPDNIDPYIVPGNASSGLLPGVNPDAGGSDGSADHRLQAYCYRMVLTDVVANRVMIAQPADYDEADYELLFRAIEAGQTTGFFKLDLMPNRKTDSNNNGGISTDYIGMNHGNDWDWTTLDHDERAALALRHERWQRGLVWTLQNHTRVPMSIRNNYANWGLPADEFTDNGNWPYQLYVREARRMVSDFVMTQQYCTGILVATDSVGLAAYAMDSHNTQRHVRNGMVKNEGDIQLTLPQEYPVSYRSIVPKQGECENLLVPWSLSSSHMAFGSIRMEPVFMILSQSAAIAADLALDEASSVQQVGYSTLRPRLLVAGQALGEVPVDQPTSFIDNSDSASVVITGDWTSANSTPGFAGPDYLHGGNTGDGSKSVFFRAPANLSGMQRVTLRWTSNTNRASNVRVEVRQRDGTSLRSVNQQLDGGAWNAIGDFPFTGAEIEGILISNLGANGYVIADAVGFMPVEPVAGGDSDGDGVSDARELILGLDPYTSDAPFISSVRANADFFSLHPVEEILEMHLTQPVFKTGTDSLDFDLLEWNPEGDWSLFEEFSVPVETTEDRGFFRVESP